MDYKNGSKKSSAKPNLVVDQAILITILSYQEN